MSRTRPIARIHYSSHFERAYRKLSPDLKNQAEKMNQIFRRNAFDSKLRTHKLTGRLKNYWAFSLTSSHRVLFRFLSDNEVLFYDVGDHRIYR